MKFGRNIQNTLEYRVCMFRSSEYFCQMSSKSILTLLSYTVSKFVHIWDTV